MDPSDSRWPPPVEAERPGPGADRARLRWHFANPLAGALAAHEASVPVIGVTSHTVPWELIRAAGAFPVVLQRLSGPTPLADEYLEPDVFSPRIRGIFEGVVSGEWSFLRAIVIPRTSEPEHKLFLYLREVAREGRHARLPPVYLYDLLHTRSAETHAYGLGRTWRLKQDIEHVTGRMMDQADLVRAVGESNAVHRAILQLLRLRNRPSRLGGTEAVELIGARQFMDRAQYAALATRAAAACEQEPALTGVRVMLAGAPVDGAGVHSALEAMGSVVAWEEDALGVSSAAADIPTDGDPIAALFDRYYFDTPSPRVFPNDQADRRFEAAAREGIDAAVFHLPPDDNIAGWDYPRRKRVLDTLGIPSLVLRADTTGTSRQWLEPTAEFVRGLSAGG